jgi:hypothetical protein
MAFYIIEKLDQLNRLGSFGDCFVDFIPNNNNYHPKLSSLSLIYIKPLNDKKGYILCLNHSESLSLDYTTIIEWVKNNTSKLFIINKKQAMYYFPFSSKLYDINFIENIPLDKQPTISCIEWYNRKYINSPILNQLIPLSKHYEDKQNLFNLVLPIIKSFKPNVIFDFNNNETTEVFFEIEKKGIKIDKNNFIKHYLEYIKYPEFNVNKGRIYSQYHLYTTTGRPSNSFNNINFAALNKSNGERECYVPQNDWFIEFDFQGYHPRLIGEMVGFDFPKDKTTYEYLSEILGVTVKDAKELTFKQTYGSVWDEYKSKPFFKEVNKFTENMWDTIQYGKTFKTDNRIFHVNSELPQNKLFNYIIQSKETSTNVKLLVKVLEYLKNKQTKLVLYTYDAFLFDFSLEDGKETLINLQRILSYPTNIKKGKNYNILK